MLQLQIIGFVLLLRMKELENNSKEGSQDSNDDA
jgi:hypothetical protein